MSLSHNVIGSLPAQLLRSTRTRLLPMGRPFSIPRVAALLALGILFGPSAPSALAAPPEFPPLTSVSGNPRLPGKFVWVDLVTDNLVAAQTFYTGLFGWRFTMVDEYAIGLNEERPICGMFQRQRPKDQTAQPRWFGYISTASVGKAERAVKRLRGRVLAAPKKFPERGEQAVFADPEGAVFGVLKSSSGDPEDFLAEPGDWIWVQLLTRDARKAAEFYRAVAGYDVVQNAANNRLSDYVLVSEGYARATIRTISSENSQAQPTWLPFVRVKNVAESVAKAKELGGEVRIAPKPELFDRKVAVVADPTGAVIGLLEWSHELVKGGR